MQTETSIVSKKICEVSPGLTNVILPFWNIRVPLQTSFEHSYFEWYCTMFCFFFIYFFIITYTYIFFTKGNTWYVMDNVLTGLELHNVSHKKKSSDYQIYWLKARSHWQFYWISTHISYWTGLWEQPNRVLADSMQ